LCWFGSAHRRELPNCPRQIYFGVKQENQTEVFVAAAFCARRVARGDITERDCLEDSENKDHGFLMYQAVGAGALSSKQAHMDAANNGGAEWGIHTLASSLPLGFSGSLGIAGDGDQITILHEYWHSV
jgi:hypothetical protein